MRYCQVLESLVWIEGRGGHSHALFPGPASLGNPNVAWLKNKTEHKVSPYSRKWWFLFLVCQVGMNFGMITLFRHSFSANVWQDSCIHEVIWCTCAFYFRTDFALRWPCAVDGMTLPLPLARHMASLAKTFPSAYVVLGNFQLQCQLRVNSYAEQTSQDQQFVTAWAVLLLQKGTIIECERVKIQELTNSYCVSLFTTNFKFEMQSDICLLRCVYF